MAGKPAGMMNLAVFERMPQPGRDPACWGYLSNAFVLAAHRDQGIGSLLLRALLDYADGHGYVRVVLNPSERSVPFYGRFGFGTEHGLLVRHRPELAGLPARAEPPTGAGHLCGQAPCDQPRQRSPWYSAGGPSCGPMTGSNAAE